MKYCPACRERFDEEIIKFCTRDGTPLVEADPNFSALPSEIDEEIGQETVIRRRPILPGEEPLEYDSEGRSERIVIPTTQQQNPPNVRARTAQGYVVPPPPPNTAKTVFLTILGTLAVLGFGAIIFWFLQKDTPANTNVNINANQNTNLNTNLGFDSNFNFNLNSNSNLNTNFNFNANVITNVNSNTNTRPSPTPSPRVTPSPTPVRTPSPTPEETATPRPTNTRPANSQPTPVGTPRIGPRPPPLSNRPGNANN